MNTQEWLDGLKVGDEVAQCQSGGLYLPTYRFGKVVKITPKRSRFDVEWGQAGTYISSYNSAGRLMGGRWNETIEAPTAEMRQANTVAELVRSCTHLIQDLYSSRGATRLLSEQELLALQGHLRNAYEIVNDKESR